MHGSNFDANFFLKSANTFQYSNLIGWVNVIGMHSRTFWGVRYLGSHFNEREQIDMQRWWCETKSWHKEDRHGKQRAIGHTDLRRQVP